MDTQKTGELIAAARREKGMTQRALAQLLHLSDRTISKWERGAGFPDVSVLQPLGNALDLSVTELLNGEKSAVDPSSEETVRKAIRVTREQLRKKIRSYAAAIPAALFIAFFLFACLDYQNAFSKRVFMEVPVGVYVNGELTDHSVVSIDGRRRVWGPEIFTGRFAVKYVEKTCRDGVTVGIKWDKSSGSQKISYWAFGGPWDCGVENQFFISKTMESFALKLENGTVLATDCGLAELMTQGSCDSFACKS